MPLRQISKRIGNTIYLGLLLVVWALVGNAQVNNPSIISVTTAPSGACSAGLPNQQVTSTGTQYSCQSGTWGAIGGGGGGATLPTNAVVYGLSSTTSRASTPSDLLLLTGYYTGLYSGATTYKFNDQASDGSGNNYVSLAAANTGNALTNTTWWHFLGGVSSTITGGNCATYAQLMYGISTTGVPNCEGVPSLAGFPFSSQISFGDSITYGYYASSPNSGYPYWIAQALNLGNYNNQGYVGYLSGQVDAPIFTTKYAYAPSTLLTYIIGTNNVNNFPADTNQEQNYLLNVEAQLAWWMIPSASRTIFSTGSVTYTGTWTNETVNNIGKQSTVNSSTATFTGTGTILYLATLMTPSGGSATLSCDGSATGATLYFAGTGGSTVLVDQTALTRVSGLSAGSHTCVVTVTGTTGSGVILEWAGFASGATNTGTPVVVFGGVPTQNTSSSTVISTIAAYRTNQQTAVTLLRGDGFTNIGYADTSSVGGPSASQFYNDQYHFTDYGYYLLAGPMIAEANALASTSFVEGNFIYRPISNFAPQGADSLCIVAGSCGSLVNGQNTTTFQGLRVYAIGNGAGQNITTANDITAIGFAALQALTTGSPNVAIGSQTLQNITTGAGNVAVGPFAGFLTQSTSSQNTFLGDGACEAGSAAYNDSTCVGFQAGYNNTGASNTYLGYIAGYSGTSGTNNTLVGASAALSAATDSNEIAIGQGVTGAGANTTTLGNSSTVVTVINGMHGEPVATIASATTIAPVTPMLITSGTTSIATITLPAGFTTGCFDWVPGGTQATTTAGNIAAIYTLTSGTLYRACYQGTKWYIK